MNPNLKLLIGAAVGGAVGLFIANVVIEIIYLREQTDTPEELDQMDDGYGSVTEDEFADKETFQRPLKMSTKKKNYDKSFVGGDGRPELQALVKKYNTGELSEEIVEDATLVTNTLDISEDFEMPEQADVPTDPSIISMSEYAENDESLEQVTLHYYDDDVVTDENDNPISKPEALLGDEALFEFGEDDTVYVRNLSKKCMYEVIRLNKEYSIMPNLRKNQEHRRKKEEDNASEDDSA